MNTMNSPTLVFASQPVIPRRPDWWERNLVPVEKWLGGCNPCGFDRARGALLRISTHGPLATRVSGQDKSTARGVNGNANFGFRALTIALRTTEFKGAEEELQWATAQDCVLRGGARS